MKIVELVPLINNKYIALPFGFMLIYAGVYSGISTNVFTFTNIIYIIIGIIPLLISFEKQLFGVLRYVKYSDSKLIYKRAPFYPKQEIDIKTIKEIKFYGSKIYISSNSKVIVINIDLIKMKSRLELRDFFTNNFKEKVIFEHQDNIFVERYERKLKKIEEKQRLKNGK